MSDRRYIVSPARAPLAGEVQVPGDKSIGHRALMLAALSEGTSRITGLSGGEDNNRTGHAMQALGAEVELGEGRARVHGVGIDGLRESAAPLDMGNSGTGMRLLAGILAGQAFASTLIGDESLSRRPMGRVALPLRSMGARVDGRPGSKPGEVLPPLVIHGGGLRGIQYALPVASAQVKSSILLAGLYAEGATETQEPGPSRDHTERLLAHLGVPITRPAPGVARLDPSGWERSFRLGDVHVPGDPSSAAFLVAAALVTGATRVVVRGVCVNPTRTGFLDALAAMGATVLRENLRDEGGEPVADLVVQAAGELRGVELDGDLIVRAIDEVPILAVVAARARGTTVVGDAHELRVKESDRIATTCAMLRAFGVEVEERPDGLAIEGRAGATLGAGQVDAAADHRIAMAGAIAALAADGESVITDVENVATSFPSFPALLRALGAELREA